LGFQKKCDDRFCITELILNEAAFAEKIIRLRTKILAKAALYSYKGLLDFSIRTLSRIQIAAQRR